MTHPSLSSHPLPTDIRSNAELRLTRVQLIDDRKIGSRDTRFESAAVIHTCRATSLRNRQKVAPGKSRAR